MPDASAPLTTAYRSRPQGPLHAGFDEALRAQSRPRCDWVGIVQFLLFLHPLYEKTFVEDLDFVARGPDGEPFRLRYREDREGYARANEDRLWGVLREGVARIARDDAKVYGVGNSGGMDSRVVLWLLRERGRRCAPYTLGDVPSDAAWVADRVAKRLGLANTPVAVAHDFLARYAQRVVRERPMYSTLYAWYLSGEASLPRFDLHVTGFNGDNMLGSHLVPQLREIEGRDRLHRFVYDHYRIADDDAVRRFLTRRYAWLPDEAYAHFERRIAASENRRNENVFEEFNFRCRQLRFIRRSLNFDFGGRFAWASPFYTRAFMELALELSFEERLDRRLYRAAVRRWARELADLRFERQRDSLLDRERPLVRRLKGGLWSAAARIGASRLKGNHKDVARWLRETDALAWVRDRFEEPSPVFDEVFSRRAILDGLAGLAEKQLHLLSGLLTVKLWLDEHEEVLAS